MPVVTLSAEQLDPLRSLVREEYQFWNDESDVDDRIPVLNELTEILEKAALE